MSGGSQFIRDGGPANMRKTETAPVPRRPHPARLAPVWCAEFDRPSSARAEGSWLSDGLLVRIRFDLVRAYDVPSGRLQWEYRVPGRGEVVSVARSTAAATGALIHVQDGAATAVALDLRTGAPRWSRPLPADPRLAALVPRPAPGLVAAAGDRVLLHTADAVVAHDALTGAELWCAPAPPGAPRAAGRIYASGERAVSVHLYEGQAEARMLDVATGRVRWAVSIPPWGALSSVECLSVDPLVLAATERGRRASGTLLVLDGQGGIRLRIPYSAPSGELDLAPRDFGAMADPAAVVTEDVLVTRVRRPGDGFRDQVAAFSLDSGEHLWTHPCPRRLLALTRGQDRVYVLAEVAGQTRGPELSVLDLHTGRPVGVYRVRDPGSRAASRIHVMDGHVVQVFHDGTALRHPVAAYTLPVRRRPPIVAAGARYALWAVAPVAALMLLAVLWMVIPG
ncbi:outer membrane protein assembly factor BamB family protein [Allostreptomyces psammosilenae]|uniref:Outer membrane protein assembly factor BamB n=1 Tax=Allostreptomyces psammosilenae TaxID=1892865 RepID=A0A852ZYI4_9ACTN|nr:PQQ-binding-like beta-propeller repeat protein [Allostreptomyces psammosilenae]NYI03342.1 outer membrane protein assembly factor BamB [Allostreptomyces psammosilenae]